MITAITKFKLSNPISTDEAKSIFLSTAPKYKDLPGLFRKCYVVFEDGISVGGIYLWNSRAEAEAVIQRAGRISFERNTAQNLKLPI